MNGSRELFSKGVKAFNQRRFFDAHEYWEELWLNYKLPDADLIQGLIQLTVGYFHITNMNLPGARSLFQKCLPKLQTGMGTGRLTNLEDVIINAGRTAGQLAEITTAADFDRNCLLELNQNET